MKPLHQIFIFKHLLEPSHFFSSNMINANIPIIDSVLSVLGPLQTPSWLRRTPSQLVPTCKVIFWSWNNSSKQYARGYKLPKLTVDIPLDLVQNDYRISQLHRFEYPSNAQLTFHRTIECAVLLIAGLRISALSERPTNFTYCITRPK